MREKVGKSRNTVFFQWFGDPEGRKVGSLKRRVRSQLARWEMKKCTPLWREIHFQVKMYKTHHGRTTFGSWDVEKVHAVVARSTFASQNVQNTPWPDHFWKLRCRKSARRCGAKYISKSKMYKTHHCRTTFGSWDVEKVHAVVARSTCPSQNVQNTPCSDHFWKLRRRKVDAVVARSTFPSQNVQNTPARTTFGSWDVEKVHTVVPRSTFPSQNCTKHTMVGPLLEVEMSKKCTPLCREVHFQVKIVQNTPWSDHFWKLRCRKSARRCGAKYISKSKCTKHTMLGPLLEVEMSKKCTPLWREAHFQVKMYKTHHEGDTSEGCARFRPVFVVCCVNTVGAVEVSI